MTVRTATQSELPSFTEYAEQMLPFELDPWQRKFLCPLLQTVSETPGSRELIHAPPRAGKSCLVSQRFPAWYIGCNPKATVGLASFNEEKAMEFSEVVLDIINSRAHKELFPDPAGHLFKANQPKKQWRVNARKALIDASYTFSSLGFNSGVAGKGFDLLIIDDPYPTYFESISEAVNNMIQNWWTNSVKNRINPGGSVIFMFHRWHLNDVIGWLLKTEKEKWHMTRLPCEGDANEDKSDPTGRAIGELLSPRMDPAEIAELKKDELTFSALHQGTPLSEVKAMFLKKWFHPIDEDYIPTGLEWVRYWDLAVSEKRSADYTVGALVGAYRGKMYIKDIIRVQMEWPDVRRLIIETSRNDPPGTKVGVERESMQTGFIQSLRRAPHFMGAASLVGYKGKGGKKEKAAPWAAFARNGHVYYTEGAPWVDDFFEELRYFDGQGLPGTHDDQVDAVSGAAGLLAHILEYQNDEDAQEGSREYYRRLHAIREAEIEALENLGKSSQEIDYQEAYEKAYPDHSYGVEPEEFEGVITL